MGVDIQVDLRRKEKVQLAGAADECTIFGLDGEGTRATIAHAFDVPVACRTVKFVGKSGIAVRFMQSSKHNF